jgi:type 1 fimbriae regulatory protein FimE
MGNVLALPSRKRMAPNTVNRKVLLRRGRNTDRRSREYLTPDEVAKLIDQAGKLGRHGQRDAALLALAYRHGLRVSEHRHQTALS